MAGSGLRKSRISLWAGRSGPARSLWLLAFFFRQIDVFEVEVEKMAFGAEFDPVGSDLEWCRESEVAVGGVVGPDGMWGSCFLAEGFCPGWDMEVVWVVWPAVWRRFHSVWVEVCAQCSLLYPRGMFIVPAMPGFFVARPPGLVAQFLGTIRLLPERVWVKVGPDRPPRWRDLGVASARPTRIRGVAVEG